MREPDVALASEELGGPDFRIRAYRVMELLMCLLGAY